MHRHSVLNRNAFRSNFRRPLRCLRHAMVALTFGTLAFGALAQTAPKVESAWARPTVAGQPGGGGFLTIVGGSTADRLVSASSDLAQSVQLHTMSMEGSVMHMREVPAIDVPAGKTVQLSPGGYHLMFDGLKQPLTLGEHVPLTLHFEKAGDVKVDMQVMNQAMPAMPGMPAGHTMHMN
jgi:copper(I)-binding protein